MLNIIKCFHIKRSLANTYHALAKLNKVFFDSYLNQDTLANQCRKIYQHHVKFIKTLQHTHKYRSHFSKEELVPFSTVETLHDILCSLHLLRYRFNEFALFEVCFYEIQAIQTSSTFLLYQMKRKRKNNLETALGNFMKAIHNFENLYSSTLQVVARDPSIFQYFIQDLYAFYDLLSES